MQKTELANNETPNGHPLHDRIVIGASAGGVEAVSNLVAQLPEDLPAAVFIVIHTTVDSPGILANILGRRSQLPAKKGRGWRADPVWADLRCPSRSPSARQPGSRALDSRPA